MPSICTPHPKGRMRIYYSLCFVVTKAHQTAALNGCHQDAGHKGHDHTLSLLQECFWWMGMAKQIRQVIRACTHCLQYEGGILKAPLCLIVTKSLLDLLHVDFTSTETTLELNQSPRVANILVFQNHFMKHMLAYVTPDQTALQKPSLNFYMEVTSLSLGPWPGS